MKLTIIFASIVFLFSASTQSAPLEPRQMNGRGHCEMKSLYTMGKKGTGTCYAKLEGGDVVSEIPCAGEHPVS